MYFYIDNRLHQTLKVDFHKHKPLYEVGGFGEMTVTEKGKDQGLPLPNPWANSNSTTGNAPFDQSFYLILNVAVGARNGWFQENSWGGASKNAPRRFWEAVDDWLPTWGEGDEKGMTVRRVRMWQAGKCQSGQEL